MAKREYKFKGDFDDFLQLVTEEILREDCAIDCVDTSQFFVENTRCTVCVFECYNALDMRLNLTLLGDNNNNLFFSVVALGVGRRALVECIDRFATNYKAPKKLNEEPTQITADPNFVLIAKAFTAHKQVEVMLKQHDINFVTKNVKKQIGTTMSRSVTPIYIEYAAFYVPQDSAKKAREVLAGFTGHLDITKELEWIRAI